MLIRLPSRVARAVLPAVAALLVGCEAELEAVCPNMQFFVGELSAEERRTIHDRGLANSGCTSEMVQGRLAPCLPPHDYIEAKPDRMPAVVSRKLLPDLIVEFDDRGRVLEFWATPAEPRLYAVEGSHIFVRQDLFGEGAWQYIKIHSNRTYSLVRRPISVYRSQVQCPGDLSMFIRPKSVVCWTYKDLVTNMDRHFAVSSPGRCRKIGPNLNKKYFASA